MSTVGEEFARARRARYERAGLPVPAWIEERKEAVKKPVTRLVIVERFVHDLVATFVTPEKPRTEPVTWAEILALKAASKHKRTFRGDATMVLDERDFGEDLERIRSRMQREEDERRARDGAWREMFEGEGAA